MGKPRQQLASHCSGLIFPRAKRTGWEYWASLAFRRGQPTASMQKKVKKHVNSAPRKHSGEMSNRHTQAGRERHEKTEVTRMHRRVGAASTEPCTAAPIREHSVWEESTLHNEYLKVMMKRLFFASQRSQCPPILFLNSFH